MIGIKIGGEFLDLYEKTSLTFDIRPMFYTGGDIGTIPGSYSFPINLPRTGRNMQILNYPDRLDADGALMEDVAAEFWIQGLQLFQGKATVRQGGAQIRLYLILNEISDLQNVNLNEIDLEGSRTISPTIAKASATTPANYDFIFFPVKNTAFFDSANDPGTPESQIQNNYSTTLAAFTNSPTALAAMPFIKLEYLTARIFDHIGYDLDDSFFSIHSELSNLCLYNNFSIYTDSGLWDTSMNLQNHVPEVRAKDYLKELITLFQLGIFPNVFSKSMALKPMKNVIQDTTSVVDWTEKTVGDMTFQTAADYPSALKYERDSLDESFVEDRIIPDPTTVEFMDQIVSILQTKYYYVTAANAYYWTYQGWVPGLAWKYFKDQDVGGKLDPFISKLTPLFNNPPTPTVDDLFPPYCKIRGTVQHLNQTADFNLRLLAFRGMASSPIQPIAMNSHYARGNTHSTFYNYSFLLNGDRGIYSTWWDPVIDTLANKKTVSWNFKLSLKDLIELDFSRKIRVGNQNFLIKRLRPTFTASGLSITRAELMTTI